MHLDAVVEVQAVLIRCLEVRDWLHYTYEVQIAILRPHPSIHPLPQTGSMRPTLAPHQIKSTGSVLSSGFWQRPHSANVCSATFTIVHSFHIGAVRVSDIRAAQLRGDVPTGATT